MAHPTHEGTPMPETDSPLTKEQEAQHDAILKIIFGSLRDSKAPESYTMAITALSNLRASSQLAAGPGDTLPENLTKGDRFLHDGDEYQVIGTPWRTDLGNSLLDEFIAVPVDGDHNPVFIERNQHLVTT